MNSEYQNFDDGKEEEEQQKTSFIEENDDDDNFEEANENLLFDKNKDTKKGGKLPFTQDEKRIELKKKIGDTVYADSSSRQFLDNLTFVNSATADDEVDVFYRGVEIATIDLNTGEATTLNDNMISSGYRKDHRDIINYRNTTFIGQIEENTGEQGFVNEMTAENVRKKCAREMQKREGLKDPGEQVEMHNLQEDFSRLERGKKLETFTGKEILDSQIRNTRRILEFRRILEKIPAIGFLLPSAAGIVTALILFAKGQFYSASKTLQPKKTKKQQQDIINDSMQKAQEISSQILESAGDNFEVLVTIATIALVIYKRKR